MTSELLYKLISDKTDLSSTPQTIIDKPENENDVLEKPIFNLDAKDYIPLKDKQSYILSESLPQSTQNNNFSSFFPSFSHYIKSQSLIPYNDMLSKNIRSFNVIPNMEKISGKKEENSEKEEISLDIPIIEIYFKFTCDYELIKSKIKEFLELFGEIYSLNYDMNANSLKINYKYSFSAIYLNYYLNDLLYEQM